MPVTKKWKLPEFSTGRRQQAPTPSANPGACWGEHGYVWLPDDFVLRGLAEDFWTILKKERVDTGEFAE